MTPAISTHRSSWLSLVAETAGVAGASISRVQVQCPEFSDEGATVFIQLLDSNGKVLSAARQFTTGSELSRGLSMDLGLDLSVTAAGLVVAWAEAGSARKGALRARPPARATSVAFDPTRPAELLLSEPTRTDVWSAPSARTAAHQSARSGAANQAA